MIGVEVKILMMIVKKKVNLKMISNQLDPLDPPGSKLKISHLGKHTKSKVLILVKIDFVLLVMVDKLMQLFHYLVSKSNI